jgi:hypothetical protein
MGPKPCLFSLQIEYIDGVKGLWKIVNLPFGQVHNDKVSIA